MSEFKPLSGADLDPDVRRFITTCGEGFGRYPDFNSLPTPQMRAICEEVRAPWRAGGPKMFKQLEFTTPVRVRVHNPSARAAKPALIYMHGGGWTVFSIDTHDRLMREYAARADVVVIGVDYALSPEVKFPTALEQIVQVVRWVKQHPRELDIDPNHLALGGDSAGGNLALAASLKLRDEAEPSAVSALVLNYSALDTQCSAEAVARYGGAGYMLGGDEMIYFWNNYLRNADDARNPLACPIHADVRGLPPTLMIIPECDILTEQNWRMAKKLEAAGVAVETKFYKGASHSFLEAMSISKLSNQALEDTAAWLKKTLLS